jgi:hypothetical protein
MELPVWPAFQQYHTWIVLDAKLIITLIAIIKSILVNHLEDYL